MALSVKFKPGQKVFTTITGSRMNGVIAGKQDHPPMSLSGGDYTWVFWEGKNYCQWISEKDVELYDESSGRKPSWL